jgi:activating signal cointegrator complex subunit 3
MVFVHARNATVRTATMLHERAMKNNTLENFVPKASSQFSLAQKAISKSRNKQLADLFPHGLSIHHAGMLRTDR